MDDVSQQWAEELRKDRCCAAVKVGPWHLDEEGRLLSEVVFRARQAQRRTLPSSTGQRRFAWLVGGSLHW